MTRRARTARYDLLTDQEIDALRQVAVDRIADLESRAVELRRIVEAADLGSCRLEKGVLDLYEGEIKRIRSLLLASAPD